jgi:hypothetical protein
MENQIFVNGRAYECNRDCIGAMQAATVQQAQAQAKSDADMSAFLNGAILLVGAAVVIGLPIAALVGIVKAFTPEAREKRRQEAQWQRLAQEGVKEQQRLANEQRYARMKPWAVNFERWMEKWVPRLFLGGIALGVLISLLVAHGG